MPAPAPEPEVAPRRLRMPNSSRMSMATFAYLFTVPLALLLILLNLYPFLYSLWLALNDIDLRLNKFEFTGLDNFVTALKSENVHQALRISFRYSVQVTVLSTLLSLGIALLLNERFYGRSLLITISILPWAVSTYAAAILWRFMWSTDTGLFSATLQVLRITDEPANLMNINTALIWLAVAHTWHIAPLGVYFMLATLQVIPQDLYRVGRIDKLGPFGRFRHITFPYLKAPLLIVLILNTLSAINVFDLIYFTTAGGPGRATRVITYEIYREAFLNLRLGLGAAIAYILLFIVIIITVVYLKVLYRKENREAREAKEAAA
ncbi:MAG: carbohydrate ABC transporter permease [Thermomicrobiales bacterium]